MPLVTFVVKLSMMSGVSLLPAAMPLVTASVIAALEPPAAVTAPIVAAVANAPPATAEASPPAPAPMIAPSAAAKIVPAAAASAAPTVTPVATFVRVNPTADSAAKPAPRAPATTPPAMASTATAAATTGMTTGMVRDPLQTCRHHCQVARLSGAQTHRPAPSSWPSARMQDCPNTMSHAHSQTP